VVVGKPGGIVRIRVEGDSREEALANVKEAIRLYLEPVEDDQGFVPDAEVIEIAV
jgi:predicted RNase H-like HicB family nuclease